MIRKSEGTHTTVLALVVCIFIGPVVLGLIWKYAKPIQRMDTSTRDSLVVLLHKQDHIDSLMYFEIQDLKWNISKHRTSNAALNKYADTLQSHWVMARRTHYEMAHTLNAELIWNE